MNREIVILDTGPLVSLLIEDSSDHRWVKSVWKSLRPPLMTCEGVLTETAFLLGRVGGDPDLILSLVHKGIVQVGLRVDEQLSDIRQLLRKYADRPMSLTDACLVRLSEIHESSRVLTLDSDFLHYRRFRNRVIPVMMPPKGN